MKKALLLLSSLFFISCLSVKAARVDTTYIYTTYHSSDSVELFLVADVMVSHSWCSVFSTNISDSTNQTTITICYDSGPMTTTCQHYDTFELGIKKNEPLKIIAVFQEWFLGGCVGHSVYKDTFEFFLNVPLKNLLLINEQKFIIANPATTTLTLQSSTSFPPQAMFQLFDLTGRMVLAQELRERSERIDVSILERGMYLYSVMSGSERLGAGKVVME